MNASRTVHQKKRMLIVTRRVALIALWAMLTAGRTEAMEQKQKTASLDRGVDISAIAHAEQIVLDNGLRVILLEDHAAPVVALQTWVQFGSADEDPTYAGVAHVFEHMLFKGSKRFPEGDMAAAIESAGGNVNAWTSNDETVYHLTVSSRFWQQAFDALVDAVTQPLFDPEELRKEKEVIQEEIRRGKDSPDRELWYRIAELVWHRHPYQRPVIGYPETVDRTTREALLRIFQQWYVPNNMYFVAAGDFDRDELLERLRNTIGKVEPRPLPGRPRLPEPDQKEPRVTVFPFRAELARVELVFPGVGFDSPDVPALDLLGDLLGSGVNSQLYQRLKLDRDIVHDVSAYNYTPVDPGLFMLSASLELENLDDALAELAKTAAEAKALDVSEELLEAAKQRVISHFVYAQETYQGMARYAGRFAMVMHDPNYGQRYIAAVRDLTLDDLRAAAARWLRPERMNVAVLVPEGQDLPAADHLLKVAKRSFPASKARRRASSEDVASADAHVEELAPGVQLVVQRDAGTPVVGVSIQFRAGLPVEDPAKAGSLRLMADLWDQGTASRSAQQIEQELDQIGGSIHGTAGQDTVSLGGRFLREHLDQGLTILSDVLLHPAFPEREFTIEKTDQLREIEATRENKFRYAYKQFLEAFYGAHPYGRSLLGTTETVQAIARDDLRDLHRRVLSHLPVVVSVVGDVDVKAIAQKMRGWWRETGRSELEDVTVPEAAVPVVRGERSVADPGNQTHIIWAFPTVDRHSPDRAALRVLDAALSGMGGRLFTELRDKKSLAYSVTAFDSYPEATGFFAFYIGCAPDKRDASIAEFQRVVDELRRSGITREEVERGKRFLLGNMDIGLQATSARASAWASGQLLQGQWDYVRRFADEIAHVDRKQVQKVIERYLKPEAALLFVLDAGAK
ncbi:MAG: insulinase family protein [Candidatus Dadabacteria bacterium]|nr:MAG: insulinase family protein [Candidatus Dadabacteria bacterium]